MSKRIQNKKKCLTIYEKASIDVILYNTLGIIQYESVHGTTIEKPLSLSKKVQHQLFNIISKPIISTIKQLLEGQRQAVPRSAW
jgi:hypothetical protein